MSNSLSRRDVFKYASAVSILGASGACIAAEERHGHAMMPMGTAMSGAFKNGQYVLPDLPYSYEALEPQYEQRTLRIHHTKHHAGYVRGLNKTLGQLDHARVSGDMGSIKPLSRALAFHGSGHVLHCMFWDSMTPGGTEVPDLLAQKLHEDFGSVKNAMDHFAAATKAVEASGWGVMAYEPIAGKILILQAEKHQNLGVWGVVPLLVCDVWEHAYYLQYQNNRGSFVDQFMKIANWDMAAVRLKAAM